jgi:hypothetical protein
VKGYALAVPTDPFDRLAPSRVRTIRSQTEAAVLSRQQALHPVVTVAINHAVKPAYGEQGDPAHVRHLSGSTAWVR